MFDLREIQAMNKAAVVAEERYPGSTQEIVPEIRKILVYGKRKIGTFGVLDIYNWATETWEGEPVGARTNVVHEL